LPTLLTPKGKVALPLTKLPPLPLPFGVRQLGGVRGKLPYPSPFPLHPSLTKNPKATWRVGERIPL